jgi:hypothetical protein
MNKIQTTIQGIISSLPEQGQALLNIIDDEEVARLQQLGINVDVLRNKVKSLDPVTQKLHELGDSIQSALGGAFASIIDGTSSAKDAFKSFAASIVASITRIVAEAMALSVLKSMGLGFLGFRDGGIASEGKRVHGYSTGGVAKGSTSGYPAILHGTEAVVPLPNGKSIPVEMQGGGSQQNNIVVNVSAEGQTRTEGREGDPDIADFGKAIGEAVRQEIQTQKRNGGMLSPYGAA